MRTSKRYVKEAFKLTPVSIRGLAYVGVPIRQLHSLLFVAIFGRMPSPANWGYYLHFSNGIRVGPRSIRRDD